MATKETFFPTTAPPAFGAAGGQQYARKWRNQVWEIWGDCTPEDWGTCCLVTWVPCIAWGINMRRAFALSMLMYAGIMAAALYGPQVLVQIGLASCAPEAPPVMTTNGEQIQWNLIYMVHTPIALGFFVYAAYQRGQMRKKFGIAGSEIEDYLCWVVCGLCTLCQETRTLASNDVEAGVWPEVGEKRPILQAPKQQGFGDAQPYSHQHQHHGATPPPGMQMPPAGGPGAAPVAGMPPPAPVMGTPLFGQQGPPGPPLPVPEPVLSFKTA